MLLDRLCLLWFKRQGREKDGVSSARGVGSVGEWFCLVKPAHGKEVAGQGGRRSWVVEVRSWEDVAVLGRRKQSGRKSPNRTARES